MKVFVAAVVIVCVLVGWLYLRGADGALTPTPTPTGAMAPVDDTAPADATVAPRTERLEVDDVPGRAGGESGAEGGASPPPRVFAPVPWQLVIRVVDVEQQPVADAIVTDATVSDAAASAQAPLRTDADGRVRLSLTKSWAEVSATKGSGSSDTRNLSKRRHAGQVVELVLDEPLPVRGVVLSAAGVPVANALVEALHNGLSTEARRFDAPSPETVSTDVDGRFTVGLWFGHGYTLTARRDGESTLSESVGIHRRQPQEVTLRFPGGIMLIGLVVDGDGAPVAGARVRGWRAADEAGLSGDYELLHAVSERDGSFTIPVKRHVRYQLIASSEGRGSSEPVWFEPSEVRPRATGTLRLVELTTITGVVERDGGAPFARVRVAATPMAGGRHGLIFGPDAEARFGRPDGVTTGDDGRFAFVVHPGTRWRLRAMPPNLRGSPHVEVRDVAPGSRDVTIRMTDADLAGCAVTGYVRRADGGSLGRYQVQLVYLHDDGSRSGLAEADAVVDGAQFTVGPLSLGMQYGLLVTLAGDGSGQPGAAPAYVGPFRTDASQLQFDFVLPAWADLPVRVVDASGEPAREVTVALWPDTPQRRFVNPLQVDERGIVVLQSRPPGRGTLHVYGDSSHLLEQEVTLTPGPNAEVVLRLPASSGR